MLNNKHMGCAFFLLFISLWDTSYAIHLSLLKCIPPAFVSITSPKHISLLKCITPHVSLSPALNTLLYSSLSPPHSLYSSVSPHMSLLKCITPHSLYWSVSPHMYLYPQSIPPTCLYSVLAQSCISHYYSDTTLYCQYTPQVIVCTSRSGSQQIQTGQYLKQEEI